MENNKQTKGLENQEKREWVFIPLLKDHILKRTEDYVLFIVDGLASAIITSKFLRKKETDEYVFFSIPEDYEIKCRVREQIDGRWETTLEMSLNAKDIKEKVLEYNKIK